MAAPGPADLVRAFADGDAGVLYLLHADPLSTERDRAGWEAALQKATTVIAHAATLTDGLAEHADVIFPAEAYAEKEGTIVHPDGRLQRLRPAIGRPGRLDAGVRAGWQVIAEVAERAGTDLGVMSGPMASQQLFAAVPFYAGLTLDAIGGRGVRWPATEAAAALGATPWEPARLEVPPAPGAASDGALRLGTWRSLWAAPEVDLSPVLRFMRPRQVVELSPARRRPARRPRRRRGRGRVQRHARARRRAAARLRPRRLGVPRRRHARPAREPAHRTGRRGAPHRRRRRAGAGRRRDRDPGRRGPGRGAAERRAGDPADEPAGRRELDVTVLATVGYYEDWWIQILKALVIFALVFQLVPIVLLAERKILGRFQHRYGPNRVGLFGALQPMADIGKLLFKEQFRPNGAVGWMFALAPAISMFTAVATLAIVPFGNTADIFGTEVGLYGIDPSIGILYAFAFGGIAFYGLMLGGWASGGKYAFLGSMRAAAQLISYEIAQGLALVGVIMMAGTLSLTELVQYQEDHLWFILPQFVGFIIWLVAGFAETNRPPFDLAEADAELVQGYSTEYGGGRFAAFYAAEYLNIIVVSAITATLFLGGWTIPWVDPPTWVDPLVVLVKTLVLLFLFIWIRATLPRLRYDQLMSLGWKVFLPLATVNALVTAILVVAT